SSPPAGETPALQRGSAGILPARSATSFPSPLLLPARRQRSSEGAPASCRLVPQPRSPLLSSCRRNARAPARERRHPAGSFHNLVPLSSPRAGETPELQRGSAGILPARSTTSFPSPLLLPARRQR